MKISPAHRLPAEFERHSSTWLAWPSRPDNWRCNAYFAQQDTIALAALISTFEPLRLAVPSESLETVRKRTPNNVTLVSMEFDDTWFRDTGPMVLVAAGHRPIAIDWRFNSWGGLFSGSAKDDAIAPAIADYEGVECIRAPMVLEGGALVTNGAGTAILTEESVLAANRNPDLSAGDAEKLFEEFLNLRKIIWIPEGLADDESGGHVDNLCAFASQNVVLAATTDDPNHPSYHRLKELDRALRATTTASGQSLTVINVPTPPAMSIEAWEAAGFAEADGTIIRATGTPLAPSHLNLTLVNGGVIVPTFNCATDRLAIDAIAGAFPDRKVIPFHCREFLLGGGGVHCLTKEIPAYRD